MHKNLNELILLASILGLLLIQPVSAQSLSPDSRKKVDDAVRKEMEEQQLVGVSIGIIQGGKIVYTKGYGLANRREKVPFTKKSMANWASNSKPVLAVRTMQLVEQGKLSLNDSVRKHVPELPKHCDKITIRHLLCHQSGYPHYVNGKIKKLTKPIKSESGIRDPLFSLNRFGGSPLIRDPGLAYSYSSYAYVILSAAVQRAGGQPLSGQIEKGITQPLNMDSFCLDVAYDGQKNWSLGYKRNAFGSVALVADYANGWKHGAGGYKSNIEDFAKWAAGLINGKLVSEKSRRQLWTAQTVDSGKKTECGLGFFVNGQGDTLKVSHSGSQTEARTRMIIYPNQKRGIVVLSNTGHADTNAICSVLIKALR